MSSPRSSSKSGSSGGADRSGTPKSPFAKNKGGTSWRLHYGPDFSVPQTLRYLGRDANSVAERVTGTRFERHLRVGAKALRVTVTFRDKSCSVETADDLTAPQQTALSAMVRRMLGLDQLTAAFGERMVDDPVMGPLVAAYPGLRVPQVPGLFEALCWAVIGQQINLAFAFKLRNRLIALANGKIPDLALEADGPPESLLPFPTPAQVAALDPDLMRSVQFSRQKISYLLGIAGAMAKGELDEAALTALPPEEALEALQCIRGVGPWSAAYAGMRALGHQDALPVGDAGLIAAMRQQWKLAERPDVATQIALMERYRPYRSLACYYLWRSLSAATDG